MFHHFCFQWCKNFPKNGKLQFSSIFFHFLSFFFNLFIIFASSGANIFKKMENCNFPRVFSFFFYHFLSLLFHFSSFLLPVVQKFSKKWKIAIFLGCFSFAYHFFIICLSFFSCFIILASSGAKIFQKIENCNFSRVFFHVFIIFLSLFYHFFIFHHFCFQWGKNFPKNGKLQFSSSFFIFLVIFLSFVFHCSSFLLAGVQKFSKKWKIAIFLEFFSFFSFFDHVFFHHFCFQWCKHFPKN